MYNCMNCEIVQLYELCIMKLNKMEAKHSQGLIWRADRLNCQSDDQIHFKVVSLFYIYTNKDLENIYIPPWFYIFQRQVQPYQYCVQVWSWREGLLTFTWVVIAITLLRICLPRWSAWHGMVWCVTTRKPCWLVWQARVWYGIRYGKVSKGMASKGMAWYQVWQGK